MKSKYKKYHHLIISFSLFLFTHTSYASYERLKEEGLRQRKPSTSSETFIQKYEKTSIVYEDYRGGFEKEEKLEKEKQSISSIQTALVPVLEEYILHCKEKSFPCNLSKVEKTLKPLTQFSTDRKKFEIIARDAYLVPDKLLSELYKYFKNKAEAEKDQEQKRDEKNLKNSSQTKEFIKEDNDEDWVFLPKNQEVSHTSFKTSKEAQTRPSSKEYKVNPPEKKSSLSSHSAVKPKKERRAVKTPSIEEVYQNSISFLSCNKRDLTPHFFHILESALKGYPKAQATLGILHYLDFVPLEEDFMKEYKEFFFQGSAQKEIPTDWSLYWIEKAAAQQDEGALFHLGWVYEQGFGVQESVEKAKESYQQAAALGSLSAKRKLGEEASLTPKEQEKLDFWLNRLKKSNLSSSNPLSLLMVGYFYEVGYLLGCDEIKALEYYSNVKGAAAGLGVQRLLKLKNSSLHEVYLINKEYWNYQVNDEVAKKIAQALYHNTSLQKLWLVNQQIGKEGAKALAEALKHNTSLQELSLEGNHIGDKGRKALLEVLKDNNRSLQILNLSNNLFWEKEELSIFKRKFS